MMDTSETYIKMCQKAREIQAAWTPQAGDWIHRAFTVFGEPLDEQIWPDGMTEINIISSLSQVEGTYHCTNEKGESRLFRHSAEMAKETCIWLPRQDQLQEMLGDMKAIDEILQRQYNPDWSAGCVIDRPDIFASMEQLWLAFVMKVKFNKTWNGEDWDAGCGY